jgi:hypothetical protein
MFNLTCRIGGVRRSSKTPDGEKMLPAISSDLPAYLLPPTTGEEGRRTTPDSFGPASQVDISAEKAIDAQSSQPGTGIYGPNGQFVEAAAQRQVQDGQSQGGSQSQPAEDQPAADSVGDTAPTQPKALETSPVLSAKSSQSQSGGHDRDLALDNFDAAIPPAAREELRALADRVQRKSSEQGLNPDEYKKLADLLTRVGRHSDAMWARTEAEKMEPSTAPQAEAEPPSILTAAGVA